MCINVHISSRSPHVSSLISFTDNRSQTKNDKHRRRCLTNSSGSSWHRCDSPSDFPTSADVCELVRCQVWSMSPLLLVQLHLFTALCTSVCLPLYVKKCSDHKWFPAALHPAVRDRERETERQEVWRATKKKDGTQLFSQCGHSVQVAYYVFNDLVFPIARHLLGSLADISQLN